MGRLQRELNLFDAVNIALGTIIGAGIFVIIGAAAAVSGPAVFLSALVGAVVSLLTGLSSAELSRRFPRGGGAYVFAKEVFSDFAGFVIGWVWLFSNTVVGATVSIGFAYYWKFFFPGMPTNFAAAFAVALATVLQLWGIRHSSSVNNVLVAFKVGVLLFFIGSAAFFFKPSNFVPLMPFGFSGILAGAATIFFAYSGFARVAVIADEIKDPARNVPRATILSIIISSVIYVLVAVAAVGLAGYEALAASNAPLATAIHVEHLGFGTLLVGIAALIATGTVLLASVLGVSRLAYTMAKDGELPSVLAKVDKRSRVPRNAVLASSLVMLALAFFADLPHIAYISSFSLLLYYAAINLCGLKAFKERKSKALALGGLLSCLVLMFSLPWMSWAVGFAVVAAGALYWFARGFYRRGLTGRAGVRI